MAAVGFTCVNAKMFTPVNRARQAFASEATVERSICSARVEPNDPLSGIDGLRGC
jgi:hypothetical protein